MSKSKLVNVNQKIAEGVTSGFQKIEDGVVGAYKKVENAFVDKFLTHDGESVEDAKKRLEAEQAVRMENCGKAAEKRAADLQADVNASIEIGRASVKTSRETGRASVEASRKMGGL